MAEFTNVDHTFEVRTSTPWMVSTQICLITFSIPVNLKCYLAVVPGQSDISQVLLSVLLVSKSMDLRKICISSLCLIHKLLFPSVLIFNFLLQLSIFCFVSQIIKELCSSAYSFQFRRLSFNGTMKKAIFFSEYDQSNWLFQIGYNLEAPASLLYVEEFLHQLLSPTILSSVFTSSTTFRSSPNTSVPIFFVFRSLSHIKQSSKHNT